MLKFDYQNNLRLKRFGIKNFKKLKKTRMIELKPFTFLVGPNGSGKSSFIQALQLIKKGFRINSSQRYNLNEKNEVEFKLDFNSLYFGNWYDYCDIPFVRQNYLYGDSFKPILTITENRKTIFDRDSGFSLIGEGRNIKLSFGKFLKFDRSEGDFQINRRTKESLDKILTKSPEELEFLCSLIELFVHFDAEFTQDSVEWKWQGEKSHIDFEMIELTTEQINEINNLFDGSIWSQAFGDDNFTLDDLSNIVNYIYDSFPIIINSALNILNPKSVRVTYSMRKQAKLNRIGAGFSS